MIELALVEEKLKEAFPQGKIEVSDMTGTKDHIAIYIEDMAFQGKTLLEQHRMVQKALKEYLDSGEIHALKIKTSIPQ
ncbi:MAG: BolA/IbaG family iron-sulfur metabolism protein [Planctomycetota bacterium]|nr:MAG: BolA/IbaG family iron-sulfur metabolism protein [Planctomycetota bacterium]